MSNNKTVTLPAFDTYSVSKQVDFAMVYEYDIPNDFGGISTVVVVLIDTDTLAELPFNVTTGTTPALDYYTLNVLWTYTDTELQALDKDCYEYSIRITFDTGSETEFERGEFTVKS